MTGQRPTPRPSQTLARGERRALDNLWLAYLASGGRPGNGYSLVKRPFIQGLERFNEGRYFEAHELFEEAWLAARYPQRLLCLALAKLGAAFEQHARGNLRSARKIVGDAQHCLAPLPSGYGPIDVGRLRTELTSWLDEGDAPPSLWTVSL